jgi:osmotically inducible protein OsmC
MPIRTSSAFWEGDLRKGKGQMKLGSGAFKGAYSFGSRFEETKGANPEELIAAAHAGCFSMALSAALSQAGYTPRRVDTTARVHLEKIGDGFKITIIELHTEADVPSIEEQMFMEKAENARKNCPVSLALAGIEIRLEAKLLNQPAKVAQ